MFKNVLFSIDKSREAREAMAIVTDVVKKYDSKLFLLSVVEVKEDEKSMMSDVEKVAQLLENAQELFKAEGIEAEIMEREGMPPFVICDVAEEIQANLIIMGCRGLGLTKEGIGESVTNRVINLAPCPVLVVP